MTHFLLNNFSKQFQFFSGRGKTHPAGYEPQLGWIKTQCVVVSVKSIGLLPSPSYQLQLYTGFSGLPVLFSESLFPFGKVGFIFSNLVLFNNASYPWTLVCRVSVWTTTLHLTWSDICIYSTYSLASDMGPETHTEMGGSIYSSQGHIGFVKHKPQSHAFLKHAVHAWANVSSNLTGPDWAEIPWLLI